MADILLQGLYEQKKNEFGTQGAGLSRFDTDFLTAVQRSIDQINTLANLSTPISLASENDTSSEVTNLDEKWEWVLSDGVSGHLSLMGRRPAKGAENIVKTFFDRFEDVGIPAIYMTLKSDAQDASDENDSIGLTGIYDD